ncbi:MAG: EAL domain-containing protein [Elusimicrobia bacterium]|nr:EAL domain-containing protein [Elusimicrobiota bacterium]
MPRPRTRRCLGSERSVHVLVFRLLDPLRIESLHGSRVTDAVYHDLTRRFEAIAKSVLRRHHLLDAPWSPELGLWMVPFRMETSELGMDEADQTHAISHATSALVRDMLDAELGSAAAMHVDYRVGILRDESGTPEPARLFEKLSGSISRLDGIMGQPAVSRETFRDILTGPNIDFHLQSVISLSDMRTVGFEALARGPVGGPVERPDKLFAAAAHYGLRRELDLACVSAALGRAHRLPEPYWLSVNLGPDILDATLLRKLIPEPRAFRRRVFEITEHLPIAEPREFAARTNPLRRQGALVALDDAGCGFLNMSMVTDLSPNIVKLCITIIRRLDGRSSIVGAVRHTVERIRAAGAIPLAEGVETAEQLRLVKECGFELAQGWIFGKPKPVRDVLSAL